MGQAASKKTRVGCCGFAVAQGVYFQTFSGVEINSSFYNLPQRATAARWRQAAPAGFLFALKAWQPITHSSDSPTYKRTRIDERDREHCGRFGFNPTVRWAWAQTYAVAQALEATVVLFQCPASFRPTKDNLARFRQFFERAKRGKLRFGWEPRGAWPTELIRPLCRELELIHVVDPFHGPPADTGKIGYYRLHGVTGANHTFTAGELQQLQNWCRARPTNWCFFNTAGMVRDAERFQQLVRTS